MVPVTLAGRVLGGVVSVIGIGTLALFSGLITVGFWNQLGLRREQPARTQGEEPLYRRRGTFDGRLLRAKHQLRAGRRDLPALRTSSPAHVQLVAADLLF